MALGGGLASAASTVVVTPVHENGWTTADTRPGGDVEFVPDATAPSGTAALQLITDATGTAKAQYMHETSTPLSSITDLNYFAKQNSASFAQGTASFQLPILLTGDAGFTTLVFEPYENTDQGAVVNGTWQQWDADAGQFWSSRSVTGEGDCAVTAGGGGAPFYTLANLADMCPNAIVVGFGVNIGSNNPSYDVEVDLVNFNGTVYDFEISNVPTSKDACKDAGWDNLTRADGSAFLNQGECVSYVTSGS
jgi:hypothetical protein